MIYKADEVCSFMVNIKLSFAVLICVLSFGCGLAKKEYPVPNGLSQKIVNLCEQYPPPNDFVPIDKPTLFVKSDRGTYGGWYTSHTSSKNVINHYEKLLMKDNWILQQENSYNIFDYKRTKYITFNKDGFFISLEFSNDENKSDGQERTYGMDCGFAP